MPEAPQWARVRGEINCYIRRGGVVRSAPSHARRSGARGDPAPGPRRAIRPPDRPPPAAKLVRGAPPPGLGRHANGLGLALRGLPRLLPSPGTAGTATRVAVCELRGRVRDRLG